MKVLLTGATGYIGKRLLPILVDKGYQVVCCVRDVKRFNPPASLLPNVEVIEVDLLAESTLDKIPKDIDGAYYLVHSMSGSSDYEILEYQSAVNFRNALNNTKVQHVVYLSGIVNESNLSKHLSSRKNVEVELGKGNYKFTALRAGIIIGSGSASFEIIRDLVEKLPIMITPKWLEVKCQPIGISDVIKFLSEALFNPATFNDNFDVGGPDVLSYKDMLLDFARARKLKRIIIIVPVMTPRLSSYWLYFVTSTSYKLAVALVNSMKIEVVCRDHRLNEILSIKPLSYWESLMHAFAKIESNEIVSSWKDSQISGRLHFNISEFINVPSYGCFIDSRKRKYNNRQDCIEKIWRIGGTNGWYAANGLWKLRGFMDKLFGGVGLRRGRTNENALKAGDAIDFWRVLFADKQEGRLLLFAEMKLPGEAWLEFRLNEAELVQTATFRPWGLWGRLYWYAVYPFHGIVFNGMLKRIAENDEN
ncbi:SDR family oxidoreductase [Reichenbachiella sp. MALMAid0571]|uniref:SDR family oxidoreductase n=1 Tax=Reichenbachiella sp. MALMAid0571 TaxID=3143939 RepID=UPI0032DFB5BC